MSNFETSHIQSQGDVVPSVFSGPRISEESIKTYTEFLHSAASAWAEGRLQKEFWSYAKMVCVFVVALQQCSHPGVVMLLETGEVSIELLRTGVDDSNKSDVLETGPAAGREGQQRSDSLRIPLLDAKSLQNFITKFSSQQTANKTKLFRYQAVFKGTPRNCKAFECG